MAYNPAFLAEEPEQAVLRLQRQRTMRMTMALVAVVAALAAAFAIVTIGYGSEPAASHPSPMGAP